MNDSSRPLQTVRGHRGRLIDISGLDDRAAHLLRMREALPHVPDEACFSGHSAAVAHGLPLWGADLSRVQRTLLGGGHGQITERSHTKVRPLELPEVVFVDGLPVTTIARTAGDMMRTQAFGPALALADSALRLGASRADLLAAVKTGRGCRHATEAVLRADARSESPYESISRALFLQEGLPLPDLQKEFHDGDGLIGRVDFWWKYRRLIGEFDGAIKYDELLPEGWTRADVEQAQDIREWRLRRCGFTIVRWTKADLDDRAGFLARMRFHLPDRVEHGLRPESMDLRRPRRHVGR